MAKPGSGRARSIANGVPDLSLAKLSDEQAYELQAVYELKMGMRCSECHRRITVGFHFTSLDVRSDRSPVLRLAACTHEECDFTTKAKDGAVVTTAVEYVWLDDAGPGAPAPPGLADKLVFMEL